MSDYFDSYVVINGRRVGPDYPVYIIAEMSANHGQSFEQAVKILEAAKDSKADAIKLQTFTPDTITIDCDNRYFRIKGTPWDGRVLHDLYREAFMPWSWFPRLKEIAHQLGLDLFSSPFDESAVDFLKEMQVPAYKIASFEIVDLPLLHKIGKTGKPVIMSTGMATLGEIEEAVNAIREVGGDQLVLLKCTSAYPASPEEMNLRVIPHLAEAFGTPIGLSDHTLNIAVPVVAATLGACIIEKHLTLSRAMPGPDAAFSLEPNEFKAMVEAVRTAEMAKGNIKYGVKEQEAKSRIFRRSLFLVEDIKNNEMFTDENVRSIRPAYGLHPRHLPDVIGRFASRNIKRGTPLSWDMVGNKKVGISRHFEVNKKS